MISMFTGNDDAILLPEKTFIAIGQNDLTAFGEPLFNIATAVVCARWTLKIFTGPCWFNEYLPN